MTRSNNTSRKAKLYSISESSEITSASETEIDLDVATSNNNSLTNSILPHSLLNFTTPTLLKKCIKEGQIELHPIMKDNIHISDSWTYFSKIYFTKQKHFSDRVACSTCFITFKVERELDENNSKKYGTSTLRRHYLKCSTTSGIPITAYLKKTKFSKLAVDVQEKLDILTTKFIVSTGSPFIISENPDLKNLIDFAIEIKGKYQIDSIDGHLAGRKKIKKCLVAETQKTIKSNKEKINDIYYSNDICLSTDISTDSINKVSYIGVIIYWISGDSHQIWKKNSLLIAFNSFQEAHTTSNISKYLSNLMEDFNISNKFPLITDSAANMLKLQEKHPITVCFAHRLNTVVSNSFKETMKTDKHLENLHVTIIEVIKYINKASNLKKSFKTTLKQGGITRAWRSIYAMYSSISSNYDELKKALVEKGKYEFLSLLDKTTILEITNILEPFSSVFDMLERSSVNLHLVIPCYFTLRNHLHIQNPSNKISPLIDALSRNLDLKYEGSFSSYQIAACWLAPCFKDFRFCSNQSNKSEYITIALDAIKCICVTLNENTNSDGAQNDIYTDNIKSTTSHKIEGIFDWMNDSENSFITDHDENDIQAPNKNLLEDIDDEIDRYTQNQLSFKVKEDLLYWWYKNRNIYPILASIARNVLVIPASSSEIERRFSRFNSLNIVTKKRNRMKGDTVENLMIYSETLKKDNNI